MTAVAHIRSSRVMAYLGAGLSAVCLVPGLMEALNSRGAVCSDEVVTAALGFVLDRWDKSEFAV